MSEATVITLAAAIIYAGRIIAEHDGDFSDPLGPSLVGALAEAEGLCAALRKRRPELFEAAHV